MNIKRDRLVKAVDDDSLSPLWATNSNSSRTDGCDEHVKSPSSQRSGGEGAPPVPVPLHLLKLESETRRITQLTLHCPPHAQSGLISCLASRSLVTTETTQSTGGKKKECCPLRVCMDGLYGRMRKLGVGWVRLRGRVETKQEGWQQEEEAKSARTENKWVKVLEHKRKG